MSVCQRGAEVAAVRVKVEVGDIARWEDEVIVVNLFEGVDHPGGATGAVDAALGHQIMAMMATGDLSGKFKDVTVFPTFDKINANRVMVERRDHGHVLELP